MSDTKKRTAAGVARRAAYDRARWRARRAVAAAHPVEYSALAGEHRPGQSRQAAGNRAATAIAAAYPDEYAAALRLELDAEAPAWRDHP